MNHGYIRVAAAIPQVKVADCEHNAAHIKALIERAAESDVQIVCFPELSVTAYTCADLFHQQTLLDAAESELKQLMKQTAQLPVIAIVGMPVRQGDRLFNCAVVFKSGTLIAVVPKTHLPNYQEFYEKRWFASSINATSDSVSLAGQTAPFGVHLLIGDNMVRFSIELCEDLWAPFPPSSFHSMMGSQLVFNLSAGNETTGKNDYLKQLVSQQSARTISGYVYAGAGTGESTQDLVFAGNGIVAENGKIVAKTNRFSLDDELLVSDVDVELLTAERQKKSAFSQDGLPLLSHVPSYRMVECLLPDIEITNLYRTISATPFIPSGNELSHRCNEIVAIQVGGLAKRLMHTQVKAAIIGISGGLDSTLTLLATVATFDKLKLDRRQIIGITMPGFGTTQRTRNNAVELMKSLGVSMREIDITAACLQHFKDIGHDPEQHDVTYENAQARERTQILMDIANRENGLVIGTGDLSELALGWCTYNGDQMSMYAINSGIPKTLIRHLVQWIADNNTEGKSRDILYDILDTPVSPELLPSNENGDIEQKTEDIVGPYELHDFFLYHFVRYGFTPTKIFFLAGQAFNEKYSKEEIRKWLTVFIKRFFSQQFKRSCMPDGPKVGSINLSPRGDWRMPSDAAARAWLKDSY